MREQLVVEEVGTGVDEDDLSLLRLSGYFCGLFVGLFLIFWEQPVEMVFTNGLGVAGILGLIITTLFRIRSSLKERAQAGYHHALAFCIGTLIALIIAQFITTSVLAQG